MASDGDRPDRLLYGLGRALGLYLKFVGATTRFVREPGDYFSAFGPHMPFIVAGWHGEHYMFPFIRNPAHRVAALISKSRDGAISAGIADIAGLSVIRGSGGRARRKTVAKGGIRAFLDMKSALGDGMTIGQTADAPHSKVRRCGEGIIKLAQHSGRPIVPCAVATRHISRGSGARKTFIPLPFGRGAIIFGEPIYVPKDADAERIEALRQEVEAGLNAVNERAHVLVRRKA